MTPDELKAAKKIARIMRAARKRLGISQHLMCKNIGVSQSTLSRMEKGDLIPSAYHWVEFCRITAISPSSYVYGFIDSLRLNSPPTLRSGSKEGHFTLPAEYSSSRGVMIRELRVPLLFMESRIGEQAINGWLNSHGMDPDYFVDLNNQLNLKFSYDLFDFLIKQGTMTSSSLDEMTRLVSDTSAHGNLKQVYDQSSSYSERLRSFVANSSSYELDFDYQVVGDGPGFLDIAVKPQKHVADFAVPESLGDSLCQFRKKFIENFSAPAGSSAVHILETQCQYHGAESCLYRVPIQ